MLKIKSEKATVIILSLYIPERNHKYGTQCQFYYVRNNNINWHYTNVDEHEYNNRTLPGLQISH